MAPIPIRKTFPTCIDSITHIHKDTGLFFFVEQQKSLLFLSLCCRGTPLSLSRSGPNYLQFFRTGTRLMPVWSTPMVHLSKTLSWCSATQKGVPRALLVTGIIPQSVHFFTSILMFVPWSKEFLGKPINNHQ